MVAHAALYNETFFSDIMQSSLQSAEIIVPLVINLVHPESVVDVGCGTGAWLSVFKRYGVTKVLGIDGEYVNRAHLLIQENEFLPVDLRRPFPLNETFDLALCLEVAEHLPASCARGFIEWLTTLAPFVLFSAALPGQGGVHHVNLQWPDYWERLFSDVGFVALDPIRPLIWQDDRIAYWYRQNCYLFVRSSIVDTDKTLQDLAERKKCNRLMLIHADVLAANLSLSYSLRRIPGLIISSIRRYFQSIL